MTAIAIMRCIQPHTAAYSDMPYLQKWVQMLHIKDSNEDLQPGCKEAALVFGLVSDVNSLDEVHIQHAPLQELHGFRILRVYLMTRLPARQLGVVNGRLQLIAAKCMVGELQQH